MTVHSQKRKIQDKSGVDEEKDGEKEKDIRSKGWQGNRKNTQHFQHAVSDGVSNNTRATQNDIHISRLNLSLQRKTQEVKKILKIHA